MSVPIVFAASLARHFSRGPSAFMVGNDYFYPASGDRMGELDSGHDNIDSSLPSFS